MCIRDSPFTVSGIDRQGRLRVCIKALGPCSQRLQDVEAGVLVHLEGPFGSFLDDLGCAPRLWIAGGIGITPFIAKLRAQACRQPTTIVYLYRHAADAAFLEELAAEAREDPLFELLGDASGEGLPDIEQLLEQVSRLREREVHLCGPQPLLAAISAALRQRGVSSAAIHFERFDFR